MARRGAGRSGGRSRRDYPRTARVAEVVREVVATELERIDDEDLGFVTVTGVEIDPEFFRALVYFDHLDDEQTEILDRLRPRLQRAVGNQVRLKRTPELMFRPDPAVEAGERIEGLLRGDGDSGDPAEVDR